VCWNYLINQSKYNKFASGVATVQIPMSETTLSKEICMTNEYDRNEMKNIPYKAEIECLLGLDAGTRFDIAYATQTSLRHRVDSSK